MCPPHLPCSLPTHSRGRWTFGDGEQVIRQFKPPYNESWRVPDPAVAQVLLEHNVSHSYAAPGEHRPMATPLTALHPMILSPSTGVRDCPLTPHYSQWYPCLWYLPCLS